MLEPAVSGHDRDEVSSVPFLPISENRFAGAALERLKQSRGWASAGPLVYLHGPAGVGKSHLVRSFLRDCRRNGPSLQLLELTGEELAGRLKQQHIRRLREAMNRADLILCEDVHRLESKPEFQTRFGFLLDESLATGTRLLLTSRKLPGEFTRASARMANRCHAGVCASMKLPGETARASLLAHFGQVKQIPLSRPVVQLLANRLPVSPRELFTTLLRIDATARRRQTMITVELVCHCLDGEAKPCSPTVARIAKLVAADFDVPLDELRARTRRKGTVLPRQCAMFLARELAERSLATIARYFGRRNHATVLYACRRIQQQISENPSLRQRLDRLRQSLLADQERDRS